jgi:poly(3-hydroxybutyrate) depolymerase
MASIMLATYPEVFAGGAIIAGLPFGAADSVSDAFARMAGHGYPADTELAALVRDASPQDGPWPSLSVWHGSADNTVSVSNADRIMAQWRPLHEVAEAPSGQEQAGSHIHRIWRNDAAQVVLEQHILTGLGHGTPLKTHGADACGKAGPYMLETGISSTRVIAQFWGLEQNTATTDAKIATIAHLEPAAIAQLATTAFRRAPARHPGKGVAAVIEDALRAAGLMK